MHSKSDNIEIMVNHKADEVLKELFHSLENRYKKILESMKGSEFVLDYVQLLCYKCHTVSSFRRIENKHDVYRGKDCMKKFCEFLTERTMKIINFKKKKNEVINERAAGIV